MVLDAYTLVILRRPPDAPQLPDAELDRLQAEHLAFLASLREQGAIVVNGPVIDQPDVTMRGLAVYRLEAAAALSRASQDPLVRAGRLRPEVMTWLVPPGLLGDRPAYSVEE